MARGTENFNIFNKVIYVSRVCVQPTWTCNSDITVRIDRLTNTVYIPSTAEQGTDFRLPETKKYAKLSVTTF